MADLYYNLVTVLFSFEGPNGSTNIIDTGSIRKQYTSGGAALSNAQSKYGSTSFTSTSQALSCTTAANETLTPFDKDFTIEFYIRYASFTNAIVPVANAYFLTRGWQMSAAVTTGLMSWSNTASGAIMTESSAPALNTWYHYAVTRQGSALKMWRDGVQVASATDATNYDNISTLLILAQGGLRGGYMDLFRFTKGVARYTATFTPPDDTDWTPPPLVLASAASPVNVVSAPPMPAISYTFRVWPQALRDMYNGGDGRITGTTKNEGIPADIPVVRRVRLHRKTDGTLIRDAWSAADGSYAFNNIKRDQLYYVIAHDHTGAYNAVIKDSITPEVMP